MKIAVITDIHGNIDALRAVTKTIDTLKPDRIVCLGDMIGGGAFSNEVVTYLRKRKDVSCLLGNHETGLIFGKYTAKDGYAYRYATWLNGKLSDENKKFLKSLPTKRKLRYQGVEIVCMHYPYDTEKQEFSAPVYKPTPEQLEQIFAGETAKVILFGHEHTGGTVEYNGKYYLNFGTVGNFLEKDTAFFGIVEIKNGEISYERVAVGYDDEPPRRRRQTIEQFLKKGE